MITKGNPDLDPENIWTWDLGVTLSQEPCEAYLDLTYFMTNVDDKISLGKKGEYKFQF